MKIVFNNGKELAIQSATIQGDGSLLIKTISASEDELRVLLSDSFGTEKIKVVEREQIINTYEGYTTFDAVVKYTAGIIGAVLFKAGETPAEKMAALQEENVALKEQVDMLQGCVLEMSEQVYQ